jgi:hypothetical protein
LRTFSIALEKALSLMGVYLTTSYVLVTSLIRGWIV